MKNITKKILWISALSIFVVGIFYHQKRIVDDERDFATFGFIRKGAIYTLVGDKPISDFGHRVKPHTKSVTPEEVGFRKVKLDLSKLRYSKNDYFKKNPIDMWKRWKKRHNTSGKHFALVLVDYRSTEQIYLVNKPALKEVLSTHYHLIVDAIHEEFNISQVLQEIDNPNSFFWKKIMSPKYSRIQMGLCFGYGLENATQFEKCITDTGFENAFSSNNDKHNEASVNLRFQSKVSLKDLFIPVFRFFKESDPTVNFYKKERARIQKEYKDADLRQLLIDALKN
ncbi:MAG: hypothetical protein SP4CHLAM5_11210 [Chlamydiia bacterium]|nr:hypothetical protein [Chlamydiia bacterium]MCH9618977.1 hypothetical protein [Chlamydiia bacterium]MCH9623819.1 hypothetical protein [Chlamydiia bacterium]